MRDYAAEQNSEFRAKVQAVNEANEFANQFHPILRTAFESFLNQKIETVTGALLAKVSKKVPEFPNVSAKSMYRYHSQYSLSYLFKTCVVASHGIAQYYEVVVCIGDMKDGVLTKLHDVNMDRKTNYNVDAILAQRELVKSLKTAYENERNLLHPFGE